MSRIDDTGHLFATADQELLLQASLLQGEKAVRAWDQWLSRVDFEGEIESGSFRLLPLLFFNLNNQHVDHPLMNRLKGIYRHSWFQNQRLFHTLSAIIRRLNEAGIEAMLLKGAALTVQVYANYAIRPMADFDILVKEEQARTTLDILGQSGWLPPENWPVEESLRYRHSVCCTNKEGYEFDLHWHPLIDSSIVAKERSYETQFWKNSVSLQVVEQRILAPDLPESLFLVIMHGIRANVEPPIRWIPDACFLIRNFPEAQAWDRFLDLVRCYGVSLQVIRALQYLEDLLEAPIPESAYRALEEMPVTWRDRLVFHESGREGRKRFPLITRLPGFVEYLRVCGNQGYLKMVLGAFPYIRYRLRNKSLFDIIKYCFSGKKKPHKVKIPQYGNR